MPKQRVAKMFERLAADLSGLQPSLEGSIYCPLCFRLLDRAALAADEVTEEHIIQRAIGGRRVTLSCGKCNHTLGARVDSHLVARIKIERAFQKNGKIEARVTVAGHKVRAFFIPATGEKGDPISLNMRMDKPEVLSAINRAFRGNTVDSLKVELHYGYIENVSRLGLIKAAHLAMYNHLGHRYILSPAVRHYWRSLSAADFNQLDELIQGLVFVIGQAVKPPTPVTLVPVAFEEGTATIVVMRLPTGCFGVLIPAIEAREEDVFETLRRVARVLNGR